MKTLLACFAATLFASMCQGQAPDKKPEEPQRFYKLDLVLKEFDGGKATSSHAYTMTLGSVVPNNSGSVRTGDKIPVTSGPPLSTQFTYVDVGVNIDCRIVGHAGNDLVMTVVADISSASELREGRPLIGQTRWNSTVVLPVRKATTVLSADAASGKRQTQLEITATPLQ